MSLRNKIIKFLKKTHLPQRPPDFCSLFVTQSYILEDNKLTYFMTAPPPFFLIIWNRVAELFLKNSPSAF